MKFTTIERLNEMVSATYGAVLQFGDFVFVTDCHWRGGFTAAIYTFDQTASNAGASAHTPPGMRPGYTPIHMAGARIQPDE